MLEPVPEHVREPVTRPQQEPNRRNRSHLTASSRRGDKNVVVAQQEDTDEVNIQKS